jgi:hypothetical protein
MTDRRRGLTLSEASLGSGIPLTTLRRWIAHSELPWEVGYQVNAGRTRVIRVQIDDVLETQERMTRQAAESCVK